MKTKQLLCALALLACIQPLAAWADVYQDPVTKVNYVYTPGSGVASVKGGEADENDNPITGSPDAIGEVTLLSSFTVDDKEYIVKTIEQRAFFGSSGLTSIVIPNSIKTIYEYAFCECTNLTGISIPNSINLIDMGVFSFCSSLTSITIPGSVKSIGYSAFWGCTGLTSITLPNSVTNIGDNAFWNCNSLTSITIPNSVSSIGRYAFNSCISLKEITIPSSVKKIEGNSFAGCTGLTSMKVDVDNPKYDSRDNCNAIIETASNTLICGCKNSQIPNTVTGIREYAFLDCENLTDITIPNNVKTIGYNAFSGCCNLSSIVITEGVETLGSGVFGGCSSLTSISIPNSVTTIGQTIFADCYSLASIVVEDGNTIYDSRNNCNAIIETASNTLISGCKETVIPSTVESIGSSAFAGCIGLTSIEIPKSVGSIESEAFANCTGLTSIELPESISSIESSTFEGCTGLTSIIIPKNVNTIGYRAFAGCSSLTSIKIPEGISAIEGRAFFSCKNLSQITIPSTLTSIGEEFWSGEELEYEDGGFTIDNVTSGSKLISFITNPNNIDVSIGGFISFDFCSNATLYVPAGTKVLYQETEGWKNFMNIVEMSNVSVTLTKEMVTFTSNMPLYFSSSIDGLSAYVITAVNDEGKAILTKVTGTVPAGTGLILKGTEGKTYEIPSYATEEPLESSNLLIGVTEDTAIGGNGLDYILKDGKFVKALAGTLKAGKAYLRLDTALGREVIGIDGITTGIVESERMNGVGSEKFYNLSGQRVSQPKKGLYIVNGKKVIK